MSQLTVKDVARFVHLDPSSVSRILNGALATHKYARRTVERVKAAAARLGYRPSYAARALRTGKSFTCALVVPNIANPFFAALAARLEHHLGAAGRRLLISSTGMSPQRQEEQLEDLLSRGIDGVIISACCTRGCQRVADAGVALVTVDRPLGPGIPHVGMDDHEAGRVLGRHLASRGCQRVGVAVVPSRQDACFAARLWGLRDGFGRRDGMAPVLNIRGVLTRQKARDCVAEHLALGGPPPDTLVGLNNVCTFGLLDALAGAGLGVAEAISVAGIDDFPAASLLRPPLTVVAQPVEAIAATAASLLEEAQARKPTRHVLLAPELVVRASVGGPERGLR